MLDVLFKRDIYNSKKLRDSQIIQVKNETQV